jgi:hypothetical protein
VRLERLGQLKNAMTLSGIEYVNTRIKTDKGASVGNKKIYINQGVIQGCPMSPTLFHMFFDKLIRH